MCGIVGYIGDKSARPILVEGLRRLEYRGYDSAGLALLDEGALHLTRRVGRVRELDAAVSVDAPGHIGIAHTRWATHGGVTVENAHPHRDRSGRVAVVHNGIIENMAPLAEQLRKIGVELKSETDTEVLAQIIGLFADGMDLDGQALPAPLEPLDAVRAALQIVRGTWGLAVLFADHPDKIFVARNGSPLVVGLGEGETFLSSDPHILMQYTRRVVFLEDRDLAVLDRHGVTTSRLDGQVVTPAVETLDEVWGEGDLGDYPHFMLKEIHEQPEAIRRCLTGRLVPDDGAARLGGLDLDPRGLLSIRRITMLGCGTAYYAASLGAHAIEHVARIPATAELASEFRHRNPCIDPDALYFAVSQSGETADTLGAVKEIQIKGGRAMGIVNVVGSSIARACGAGVYIHSGPEMAVASTKAFSSMVTAEYLFALMLGRTRSLSPHDGRRFVESLQRVPDLLEQYLEEPGPIDEVVGWVTRCKLTMFLGRGLHAAVAREGALKLMEVAYVPCLAYAAGEMKHGPIALLEEGTPVIVIAPDDPVKEKTLSNLQECKARGARTCVIHTAGDTEAAALADVAIAVPKTAALFSPLLTVAPLQLLAYKAGMALGRDIDRPRNLAKSVTVE